MPSRQPQPPPPTAAELTAGTGVTPRALSPADIHSMIDTHAPGGGGGGMSDLVDDLTPQLGGNLDVNGFTVDGRDPSVDGAKLDGIESGADVTDATNVNAAGAVMESDFTPAFSLLVQQSGTGAPSVLQVGTNTLLGRVTGGGSEIDDLSPATVRSLLNVEDGATADQTGAQIKAAYEAEPSAFTDAQFTKLAGVETGATADQTGDEIKAAYEGVANTNAFTDAEQTKLGGIATGADVSPVASVNTKTGAVVIDPDDLSDAATTNKFTSAADISKLSGIETGATADQTGAQIKSAYEGEVNTNAFTDAEQSKLSGISAGAEVNAVDTVNGATGDVVVPLVVNFLLEPTSLVITNLAAARTLAFQSGLQQAVDLSRFTEARLFVFRGATAGQAGSVMSLEYATSSTTSLGSWASAGTSAIDCDIATANAGTNSGWVALATGAKADVYIGVTHTGGDGAKDPKFVVVMAQFR